MSNILWHSMHMMQI